MSTRSHISIMNDDGSIELIYCHWDGYPEGVGQCLVDYYNTEEKARELIALGDISSLERRIAPFASETHTFENPANDVTVAYHRDRGESWEDMQPRKFENLFEALKYYEESWAEYWYIFRNGSWHLAFQKVADFLA